MHSRSLGQIAVEMNKTKEYLIPFIGLKTGKHHFEYQISNSFFEIFDYQEFNNSNIKVNVVLEKKSTMLELAFKHKGSVNVPCDMTNEEEFESIFNCGWGMVIIIDEKSLCSIQQNIPDCQVLGVLEKK